MWPIHVIEVDLIGHLGYIHVYMFAIYSLGYFNAIWSDYHYIALLLLKKETALWFLWLICGTSPNVFLHLLALHLYYHTQWVYEQITMALEFNKETYSGGGSRIFQMGGHAFRPKGGMLAIFYQSYIQIWKFTPKWGEACVLHTPLTRLYVKILKQILYSMMII